MRRAYRWFGTLLLLAAAGCFTDAVPRMFVNIDNAPETPSTTSADTVSFSGELVRSPPNRNLRLIATITGGAETVTDTAGEFGLFDLQVPLRQDTENRLELIGSDGQGNESEPRVWLITHESPTPTAPPGQ